MISWYRKTDKQVFKTKEKNNVTRRKSSSINRNDEFNDTISNSTTKTNHRNV